MHEQIYTWVFCEVFELRNFNFFISINRLFIRTEFSSADAFSPTDPNVGPYALLV